MEYEYLSLGIGKLEVEWSKNIIGPQDHSRLFQPGDKTEVDHFYDENDTVASKLEGGYSKSVGDVRERLIMLGYSYGKLASMLNEHVKSFVYEQENFRGFKPTRFIDLLKTIDISQVDWVEHEGDADYGDFFSRRILTLPQFQELKDYLANFSKAEHYIFEQIDPLIILAALAENSKNRHLYLQWRAKAKHLGLDKYQKYLVVTEGYTDGEVIKKALEILRPEIVDFFDFIDMRDNYPFDGVGNMVNFYKGLAKIGTDRKMVFIFDNDTEGCYNLSKLNTIPAPSNMITFKLPDLQEFTKFRTKNKGVESVEDVNARAVAIEMYLDHNYILRRVPFVDWKAPHTLTQLLQGALDRKMDYFRKFMALEQKDYYSYDFSKLEKLLDKFLVHISKSNFTLSSFQRF